ncbi:tetratricopeptide repeat-containing sulfotransferase family protein [Sulfitobacter mediterraneus]|uniref:tetratricopeptide repeat-containing sulfotransferase family protein n=1 Tax=Sulfitobacter mediterraneus TaxID=83219 RepID=UPI00249147FD|nr:tetratricopeptide repeat-containing sulfotransferase family protein [Sulfitobacter mediterraneus]
MAKLTIEQTLLKARSLVRKGEISAARQLYETLLTRFPKNMRARRELAALVDRNRSASRASLIPHLKRMARQLNRDEVKAVEEDAASLLEKHLESAELWNIYGAASARVGNLEQAEHAFRESINLQPNQEDALGNLASIYAEKNELDAAIDYYQRAISATPGSPNLLVRMGVVLKKRGDFDAAQRCFEQVLSRNPNNTSALLFLGTLLKLRQNYVEAVSCFSRLMPVATDKLYVLKNITDVPVGYLSPNLVRELQESLDRVVVADDDRGDWMFVQAHLDRHKRDVHKAFDGYCTANEEKLKTIKDDLARQRNKRDIQLKLLRQWTPTPLTKRAEVQVLIILGPSRSGKTTLETMLQGSPLVASAYEVWRRAGRLTEMANMHISTWQGVEKAGALLSRQDLREALKLDEVFYKNEDMLIAEGTPILTATSPGFINHISNLVDLLPGVCFCYLKRDPVEVAAQIFATNYGQRNTYSYDPDTLLNYLDWYEEMWATISGKVRGITLKFEDVLTDPQQAIGQIEALLGRELKVQDVSIGGFRGASSLSELFAQRFAPQPV